MKINIQTLKNAKHSLDVSPSDTIAAVKRRIHSELNLGEVDEQKLIFVGKILKDETTVESCNIVENANIVIMVTKKKKAAAPEPVAASQSAEPTAVQSTSQPEPAAAAAPAVSTPAESTPAVTAAPAVPATQPVTQSAVDPVYEEAVTNLMSFGFPRDQVLLAMRAAFNNADRAAEYLFSGIPAGALSEPAAQPAAQSSNPSAAPSNIDLSPLGDLTQLRTLLASNPQMLPALLGQLAQSHPEMLQQLEEDPHAFVELIQALGIDPNTLPGMQALDASGGAVDEQGRHVIQITEEEQTQIQNLMSFGFPRAAVVEAWLLCDRDSEMAAAYLLEHAAELAAMGDDTQFMQDDNMQDQNEDDEEDFDPSQYME